MTSNEEPVYLNAVTAAYLVKGYPPVLRDEILSRSDIVGMRPIEAHGVITIGNHLVSIEVSLLFPAIRAAYDKASAITVKSIDGAEWKLSITSSADIPTIMLECGAQRAVVPQFSLLNPDTDTRIAAFEKLADKHELCGDGFSRWHELLLVRIPTGDELTEIIDDFTHTPHVVNQIIGQRLQAGGLSLDDIVPVKEKYYLQFVGRAPNGEDFNSYIASVTSNHLSKLIGTRRKKAFSLCWLLCSHPSISALIDQAVSHSDANMAESVASLKENGDPISRTGAIEVGLRRLAVQPGLAPSIESLLSSFIEDKAASQGGGFELLSVLFSAIYGFMAKRRVLAQWPPYARRLAALAQAAMVCRHFPLVNEDRAGFISWLEAMEQEYWMLQLLVDMRTEPRWFAELNSAKQWKYELLGRIRHAAQLWPKVEKESTRLGELLDDANPQSVLYDVDGLMALLPGPLEGGILSPVKLTAEDERDIETILDEAVSTSDFRALINMSLVFGGSASLAERAAKAIERQHYQLRETDDLQLYPCMLHLANVAASSRSERLSSAVCSVMRVSNFLRRDQFSIDEVFHIGLVTCAAHADLVAWTEAVGDFMTDLATRDLTDDEAASLRTHLMVLCHLEPNLWRTCGRAQAAVDLVIGG